MSDNRDTARVSVFIPAYNAADFINEAIESVLDQTWKDFELLIVDDGSTDATPDILQHYAERDPRVRMIRNKKNRGRPFTRNRGLSLARGQYVALMDADDRCHSERLARQVRYLDKHPEVDVLSTLWWVIGRNGDVREPDRRRLQAYAADQLAVRMLFTCPVHQPTIMARTAVLKAYEYDASFPVAQDHELWSRMIGRHRFEVLPERLLYYRQHEAQATAKSETIREARQRIVARQLEALGLLFDERDLYLHDHLCHFKGRRLFEQQSGMSLDRAFVTWSREWIERLIAANRAYRIYPEPAFSRAFAARWLLVCRKATGDPRARFAIWRQFLFSPLLRPVLEAAHARQLNPF